MINRYFEEDFPVEIGWSDVGNHTVLIENRISSLIVGPDEYLVSARIGNDVSVIGNECFGNCTSLEHVEFIKEDEREDISGTKIDIVGSKAFYGCAKLSAIDFNDKKVGTLIGDSAFEGSSLSSIDVTVLSIDLKAFIGVPLQSCSISADTIGISAFANCSPFTIAEISANEVLENAFSNTGSDEVDSVISLSASSLKGGAFKDSKAKQIMLSGISSIYHDEFNGGTTNLLLYTDAKGNKHYAKFRSGLYDTPMEGHEYIDLLHQYGKSDGGQYLDFKTNGVFENCKNLERIDFPSTLVSIGSATSTNTSDDKSVDKGNENLRGTDVTVGAKKINLSREMLGQVPMFRNCWNLKEIHVDATSLTSLYPAVFSFILDPDTDPDDSTKTLSIYFDGTRDALVKKVLNLDMVCRFATNNINLKYNNPNCIVIFNDGRFDPDTKTIASTVLMYRDASWCMIKDVDIVNNGSPDYSDTVAISSY